MKPTLRLLRTYALVLSDFVSLVITTGGSLLITTGGVKLEFGC